MVLLFGTINRIYKDKRNFYMADVLCNVNKDNEIMIILDNFECLKYYKPYERVIVIYDKDIKAGTIFKNDFYKFCIYMFMVLTVSFLLGIKFIFDFVCCINLIYYISYNKSYFDNSIENKILLFISYLFLIFIVFTYLINIREFYSTY